MKHLQKYILVLAFAMFMPIQGKFLPKYPDFIEFYSHTDEVLAGSMYNAQGKLTVCSVNEYVGNILGASFTIIHNLNSAALPEKQVQEYQGKAFEIIERGLTFYGLIRKQVSRVEVLEKKVKDIEELFNMEEKKVIIEALTDLSGKLTSLLQEIKAQGISQNTTPGRSMLYVLPFMLQENSIQLDKNTLCIDFMQHIINTAAPVEVFLTIVMSQVQDDKTKETLMEPLMMLLSKTGSIIKAVSDKLKDKAIETTTLTTVFSEDDIKTLLNTSQELSNEVETIAQYIYTNIIEPSQK